MIIRTTIKKILGALLVCLSLTSCSENQNDEILSESNINYSIQAPVEIYIVTDIHYLSNNINDKGIAFQKTVNSSDGRLIKYISELTDAFVYEILENKPDILIISGDLTHNGEKASHLELAEKLKEIENNGTKVYVVPGNHDINNPYAREFKGSEQVITEFVTPLEFEKIYSEFGYDEAYMRDKTL